MNCNEIFFLLLISTISLVKHNPHLLVDIFFISVQINHCLSKYSNVSNSSIICKLYYLQDTYEEIDLISKGGNYGWRVYEGPDLFHPHSTTGGDSSTSVPSNASINAIFPIMSYLHSALNNSVGSGSVTGGYVYRSTSDPCMFGR